MSCSIASNIEIREWLQCYPKFNWRKTFDFLLSPEAAKAVEFVDSGVACFVKGLQLELLDRNYHDAFNCYENGAMQYDPLCLFRLHEIYIGESQFDIEYNEDQALCHLIYSALLSQFENFDPKVSIWQKFESFWKKTPSRKENVKVLLLNPSSDYFNSTGPLFLSLFNFYNTKTNFAEALPHLKALSIDSLKRIFFPVINAIFDFLAYTYNSGYSKTELEQYVTVILDMLTNDLLFDNFFNNYLTHLKLLRSKRKFGLVFQRRLENDCFWVWSFSFQASMKNHYLDLLRSFDEVFAEGNMVLKWKNTASWVNNFIGFCNEKGIGTHRNLEKAIELYEKDLNTMPRVLFSHYRKILVLKQMELSHQQPPQESISTVEKEVKELKIKLQERLEDSTRMDCYLYYVYGKLFEKIDEDIDAAIEWYQKGLDASTDACLKNHLLCNEGWRMKCRKRLQKLQQRKGLRVSITNKNCED